MSAAQPMRPQGMNQPGQGSQYAQSGQMHGFRGVQGTPMQPRQGWNNGVQPLVDMLMKPAPDRDIKDFEDG